jgi:hypothetical protein
MVNTCNTPHAPSTGLSGTQFSTLNSAGINDPGVFVFYEIKYSVSSSKDLLIKTLFSMMFFFHNKPISLRHYFEGKKSFEKILPLVILITTNEISHPNNYV